MKNNLRAVLLPFSIYSLISLIFTWPLVANLSGYVYGYPGDNLGYIYYLWWYRFSHFHHLDFRYTYLQEAPFGMPILPEAGSVVYLWLTKGAALIFNEVVAFNLNLLVSFPLAGVFTFLLINKLTKSRMAAFLAGLVFAFSPYHLWRSYNHLDLAMIYLIPLFFYALISFLEKRSYLWAFFLGLVFSGLNLTNYYYGYFAIMAGSIFFGSTLILDFARGSRVFLSPKFIKASFLAAATSLLLFGVLALPSLVRVYKATSSLKGDLLARPLLNLISFSSRPWDFLIPTSDHPIFGSFNTRFYKWIENLSHDWKTRGAFLHERSIFLGYYSILLSLAAVGLYSKKKVRDPWFLPLLATVIFLFLFSFPPFVFIKGFRIYFPSYYLYSIFPMFRSYVRLAVFILIFVTSLASFAFVYVERRLTERKRKTLFFSSFLYILFEFANFPPAKVFEISKAPPEYVWLKEQPGDFIIAEYPSSVNIAEVQIYQRYHLKRLMNYHDLSPNFKYWDGIRDIYDKDTPNNLRSLGVKYLLLHKKPLFEGYNPVDDLWWSRSYLEPIRYDKLPKGLKLIRQFPKTDVVEVGI